MGCYCGDLMLIFVIVGGCEYIIILEMGLNMEQLIFNIKDGIVKGKKYVIIVLIELMMDVNKLVKEIELVIGCEICVIVLGYI